MNKIMFVILILLTFTYAEISPIEDPAKDIDYFILKNGMQVYILTNKKATNTNISMQINVGWDIEDEDNYGLSHLVEHMVFRDKRVPHRDYLDYFKDEGASYVNGFTSRYKTELIVKIDSNKSFWIAESFAKMIFDKDVDKKDIEIEKGAVQVEIGERFWYERLLGKLQDIAKLYPKKESIYVTHFGLKDAKELPKVYVEKDNNKDFTYLEVMEHYDRYYYPSNMILKITGNFDKNKMKNLVIHTYGSVTKVGNDRTFKPKRDATLSHKEYKYFREGLNKNYGYIGAQYLFDDCKKHIILNAFMKYVSTKIQQKLRNKEGKSYSVSTYNMQSRGAGIVSVSFDGLHDDFNDNISLVRNTIKYYVENIDDAMIEDALNEYKKKYSSVEFDSDSLTGLVDTLAHMKNDHKIMNKTHYDFFRMITPQDFKQVIANVFVPENAYSVIYRDYYWFTGDVTLMGILILFIIIFIYIKFSYIIFSYRGIKYSKKDVLFSDRIGNRFIGFLIFLFLVYITALVYAWLEYFFLTVSVGDANYLYTLDVPYGFIVELISNIIHIVLMFIILRWLVNYHARIDLTADKMYILGSKPISINKDNIQSIEIIPWSVGKYLKTLGFSFFFWKPLVQITTNSTVYYIRTNHPHALLNNLTSRWKNKA